MEVETSNNETVMLHYTFSFKMLEELNKIFFKNLFYLKMTKLIPQNHH